MKIKETPSLCSMEARSLCTESKATGSYPHGLPHLGTLCRLCPDTTVMPSQVIKLFTLFKLYLFFFVIKQWKLGKKLNINFVFLKYINNLF